ncbi:hypothetical protein CHLNCDRAFT_141382 [Chlorella variabilis]|uniref:Golgi apparatus protein 1 n=1 Tax=Chlorella variabilis TaxID=554065 RepID=E1ZSS0_CHLVA|nr:hypothetical protein CHLNCDRAFT_141382 [Chlorella variabilis]EFN51157.1 hypothetical protein CHLNCDRAFT_141382 [Chlorella variabilis]|eukprot:XP_005843259.1 hypothetical protein CHLNCDRAFT_141382 [Chlorella variabilis]
MAGGACKEAIKQSCHALKPGAGRLAACLTRRQRAAESAERDGAEALGPGPLREAALGEACAKELDAFRVDAATNINKNVPLAIACKRDVDVRCKDVTPDDEAGVLHCLRRLRPQLSGRCQALVAELEADASDDFRLDYKLFHACAADKSRLCPEAGFRGGEVQECLRGKEGSLDWECKAQLFRQEVEESDDFCEGIAPGESSVKDCLEDHLYEEGFGEGCREHMEGLLQQRSRFFRLDSVLRMHCGEDITRLCGLDASLFTAVDFLGAPLTVSEESVGKCLQDNRNSILNATCAARVRRVIAATMRDLAFNHPLADACQADRARLCGKVAAGAAGVVRCLAARRDDLAPACAAMLFDTEVSMAESIDFNWPLKTACQRELERFCGGMPHGRGRVIRCLQLAVEQHKEEVSERCSDEVAAYEAKASRDYRLNARLATACKEAVDQSCPNVCGKDARKTGCGGSILQCLQGLVYDEAIGEECRVELRYYQKMQAESIELRPGVAAACRDERAAHCSALRPGKGRVLNCLLAKAGERADFSPVCLEVLDALQDRRLLDWRTDFQLRAACGEDVGAHCAAENATADSLDGDVFRCLVAGVAQLSAACSAQVSRAARTALDFYRPAMPGMDACDVDVHTLCPHALNGRGRSGRTPVGAVRACLAAEAEKDWEVLDAAAALEEEEQGQGVEAGEAEPGSTGQEGASEGSEGGEGSGGGEEEQEDGQRRRQLLHSLRHPAQNRRRVLAAAAAHLRHLRQAGEEDDEAAGGGADPWAKTAAAAAAKAAQADPVAGALGEQQPRTEAQLAPDCLAFLDLAAPANAYAGFQDSLTATAMVTQLATIEASLGLKQGTLHNPAATAGQGVLTLTGWVAVAGVFALVTLVMALGVALARRYSGAGSHRYTMVVKHDHQPEQELARQAPYDSRLGRR